MTELYSRVHRLLLADGLTVATAESLTGGRLAAAFTSVPGVSATYVGGAVTYATALKQSLLHVSDQTVADHGVVSAECAREMAQGVAALTGADFGIATTGVAGPDRQEGKPAGTVYVGLAGPGALEAVVLSLSGDRPAIQSATVEEAFHAFEKFLVRSAKP